MDVKISDPKPLAAIRRQDSEKDRIRVTRKTLQAMLNQCQRALESLNSSSVLDDDEEGFGGEGEAAVADGERRLEESPSTGDDREADKLCDLLRSGFECPTFLEKLECAQASISLNTTDEVNSWDIVSENDLWEGADIDSNQDDYVLVRQEDIAEGIACFMAGYMLSLKEVKDLTPNQLQEALRKTFSVKKKKGKLQKAWAGSKVIYNVASWGATAIGIYQNPVILSAATKAFWTSCHVISKLL